MKKIIITIFFINILIHAQPLLKKDYFWENKIRQTEYDLRHELYRVYAVNPFFNKINKNEFFNDIDFWVLVLKKHSALLEEKIAHSKKMLFNMVKIIIGSGISLVSFYSIIASFNVITKYHDPDGYKFLSGSLLVNIPCTYFTIKTLIRTFNLTKRRLERLERDKKLITLFLVKKNDLAKNNFVVT